jgi:hypothetical protein
VLTGSGNFQRALRVRLAAHFIEVRREVLLCWRLRAADEGEWRVAQRVSNNFQ